MGRLADGMTGAADALRRLLSSRSEPTRLAAARALIELAVRLRDSVELEARLAALEAAPPAARPNPARPTPDRRTA
jgi:hypothetical protein